MLTSVKIDTSRRQRAKQADRASCGRRRIFRRRDFPPHASLLAKKEDGTGRCWVRPGETHSVILEPVLRQLNADKGDVDADVRPELRVPQVPAASDRPDPDLGDDQPRARRPAIRCPRIKVRQVGQRQAGSTRATDKRREVADYFRTIAPSLQSVRTDIAKIEKQKEELTDKPIPKCLVTTAGTPRVVKLLHRGNWLDTTGDVMPPALPQFLASKDLQEQSAKRTLTRLDLARWIVSRDNPLTARVYVNRLWRLYFGTGVSKILDDLGSQGEWPTNPELLDWMAVEFMDSGWDTKHMIKLLVTSGAYRQSSKAADIAKEQDPYNRLLAHQSRWRFDAEFVRDGALSVSGLLVDKLGGPSAKPYQPAGYWDQLNFPTRTYMADKGENQYRRGVYTWWQRSFTQPSLVAFDAPSREEAVCERNRSNIPQQALVMLNDPTYVEASRALAARIIREGGSSVADRLNFAYELAAVRPQAARGRRSVLLTELVSRST